MTELAFDSRADRAYCPGCGASLELEAESAVMTCQFCGTDSKVVRRLRRLEPELPDGPPPRPPVDPTKDYANWSCEALVWGILNGTDLAEQIKMAVALDSWPHSYCKELPALLPRYVAYMLTAPAELDKAMCGILGKLICGKDLKIRNLVIRVGQKYGFAHPGSKGLLFSLSLGDAGTVKLLLEIAEWANEHGYEDYCHAALMGVQTAIGREKNYRHMCNEILLHRLPYVTGQVRDWILKHTRLEFDVGYRQHRPWVLELIDDMATEQPELIDPLKHCLQKCGSAQTTDDYRARIYGAARMRTRAGKLAALQSMGRPPSDLKPEGVQELVEQLKPMLDDEEFAPPVASTLKNLLWVGEGVPSPLQALWDERGDGLPREFVQGYKLRAGIRD
ncbi:MAG: hypothetical protein H6839_14160 [Planctomycetes bacterium]|nr:hypothetical protein [Planctomycetota bacterium]